MYNKTLQNIKIKASYVLSNPKCHIIMPFERLLKHAKFMATNV